MQNDRRRRAAEAAESRRNLEEARGLKDPEKVKRDQQRKEEIERAAEERERQADGQKDDNIVKDVSTD